MQPNGENTVTFFALFILKVVFTTKGTEEFIRIKNVTLKNVISMTSYVFEITNLACSSTTS